MPDPTPAVSSFGSAEIVYSTKDADYGYYESATFKESCTQKQITNSSGEIVKLILSGKKMEISGSFVRVGSTSLSAKPAADCASIGSIITLTPEDGVSIKAVITERSTAYKKDDCVAVDFSAMTSATLAASFPTT